MYLRSVRRKDFSRFYRKRVNRGPLLSQTCDRGGGVNRSFQIYICFVCISVYAPLRVFALADPHEHCGFLKSSGAKVALRFAPIAGSRMDTGENAKVGFYNRCRFTGGTYEMATTVWVYPEREFQPLGAIRYQLSWEEVKKSAKDKDEIDPDFDIIHRCESCKSKAVAMKRAKAIVDAYKTAYGQVTVTKQIVDWFVEEDKVAEWADTSEVEYVD